MELTKLATLINQLGKPTNGFSICLYGNPKTGKTQLAATIAKVPQIKRVFLLDCENGSETLVTMLRTGALTADEAAKINVIRIVDTAQRPLASETVLKLLTYYREDQFVCDVHGKIGCKDCPKGHEGTWFNLSKLTHDDVVILDSGSAFGDSILSYYLNMHSVGRGDKAGWDEYGPSGIDLNNAFSVIQACTFCNFITITHELSVEEDLQVVDRSKNPPEYKTITIENKFPLIGTKNWSKKSAKYFSHVIYLHMDPQGHKGGSSTTYRYRTITGSRGGWQVEKSKLNFADIFADLYKEKVPARNGVESTDATSTSIA